MDCQGLSPPAPTCQPLLQLVIPRPLLPLVIPRTSHLTSFWAWSWSGVCCTNTQGGRGGGCRTRCGWRRFFLRVASVCALAVAAPALLAVLKSATILLPPRVLPHALTHGSRRYAARHPHRRHELVIFVLSYCLGECLQVAGASRRLLCRCARWRLLFSLFILLFVKPYPDIPVRKMLAKSYTYIYVCLSVSY